ncbi:MAG: hypothetical protein UV65_C0005G0019 [Parcubacteria group bacterium GW2011_GWF2_43_11]|nr:MAG: hypothetical protein UV65_C0005G0019 [Parcubacteria group bacterium GW2011_GWF2_43_11]
MDFIFLISTSAIISATWLLTYVYFYSPKARIERLWKEIFRITFRKKEQEKISRDICNPLVEEYEKMIRKRYKMINSLLDYYFDPEEDQEYIEENRPKSMW